MKKFLKSVLSFVQSSFQKSNITVVKKDSDLYQVFSKMKEIDEQQQQKNETLAILSTLVLEVQKQNHLLEIQNELIVQVATNQEVFMNMIEQYFGEEELIEGLEQWQSEANKFGSN